ncbi:MAG: ABC transporter ATP-binding protein [Bacteroidota bacterium]
MLKVENISLQLNNKNILKDISLYVQEGEFIGLLGPNGSGKTSLLKTIYRNIIPTEGTVLINGKSNTKFSQKNFATIVAVLMQESESQFSFSVKDIVMMGRLPHKAMFESYNNEDQNIVEESLKYVEATHLSERVFQTLSGGEKQRVLLARALTQKPQILILDEPTNHLDIYYQIEILNLVKKLGITTISALHDINLASAFCDRIYFLKEGKLAFSGSSSEVLNPEIIKNVYNVNSEIHFNSKTKQTSIIYEFSPDSNL